MRLGDHGRTVIMAVPPKNAMSGIHQQHNPVEVTSLGDAIRFAADRCARAESVRGDCAVSANDWTRAPRPNAWTLMPRSTRRPSPRTGGPTSTRSRAVTRQVRGPLEHRAATRQEMLDRHLPASSAALVQRTPRQCGRERRSLHLRSDGERHVSELDAVISETARALKPGGIILFI